MLHGSKKFEFHSGKDSNKSILRKLLLSFFTHSHLVTTEKKGRVLKSALDVLVSKLRDSKQSNVNIVLKYLADARFVKSLFQNVGPQVQNITGGYVRLVKMGQRENDGTSMVRVEWAHPVVVDFSNKKKESAKTVKPEPKDVKSSKVAPSEKVK